MSRIQTLAVEEVVALVRGPALATLFLHAVAPTYFRFVSEWKYSEYALFAVGAASSAGRARKSQPRDRVVPRAPAPYAGARCSS
jgi:hypothetical protein